ncbi:MAG TPA: diadenylate cyclase CdaA [Candidatus Polarisedimenticolaceae bacterium]|nr:diadenylate cyclase CdaA [Candidatus Polarisedimenticolaceae bacterium]
MIERLFTALHIEDLGPWAVVDIAILALLIYQLLLMIRGTRAVNILLALASVALVYVVTGPGLLQLNAVHGILGNLLFYLPLIVIVLFQNQIRHALAQLGKNPLSGLIPRREDESLIEEVSLAAASLASKRVGALIIVEREMGLRTFADTGIALDALVSYDLLMNLFTRRSPLHDGAVIIAEGRIKAASCYLPLTTNPSLSRTYGTRHRAAIGITEESDALAIVVSEERGVISLAEGGKISGGLDARRLQAALELALGGANEREPSGRGRQIVATTGESDA